MLIIANINWDAVSSISNIFLSLITLIAVFVTYRTLIVNTKAKAKILYKKETVPRGNLLRIRLVNHRDVPITVIHKGFYMLNEKNEKVIVKGEKVREKILNSDIVYYTIHQKEIDAILRRRGFNNGDKVNLYGYFITSNKRKHYKQKVKHKIFDDEASIRLN